METLFWCFRSSALRPDHINVSLCLACCYRPPGPVRCISRQDREGRGAVRAHSKWAWRPVCNVHHGVPSVAPTVPLAKACRILLAKACRILSAQFPADPPPLVSLEAGVQARVCQGYAGAGCAPTQGPQYCAGAEGPAGQLQPWPGHCHLVRCRQAALLGRQLLCTGRACPSAP